jgi:type IV secretion system protein VirB5
MKAIRILLLMIGLCSLDSAHAQLAVFDGASLQQLIQQMRAWQQQLQGMQLQLGQLQQTYAAMTGSRNMQSLLRESPLSLNYLPDSAASLGAVTGGGVGGTYGPLGQAVAAKAASNAMVNATQLSRLAPALSALIQAERSLAASGQVLPRAAYDQVSARFARLSSLIDQIGGATDPKAIADLQGRLQGEQTLLQNDAIKIAALAEIRSADQAAYTATTREAIVAAHGNFATRFQPTFPVP